MHSYKRAVVRIQPRTLNRHSIDWVWSIEHNNVNVLALAGAHRQIHRPNKGVVARADVLQINQQEIEILQHLARRLAMFAVQNVNRYSELWLFVASPFNHVVLALAFIAVLRTEERTQLQPLPNFTPELLGRVLQVRFH